MRFMFKDLMVTVLKDDAGPHCTGHSLIGCPLPTVACGEITCGITSVIHAARGAESLELVRKELENALEQISAAEQVVQLEAEVSTRAEAEIVDQKMTEALEELRRLKESLPPK